MPRNLVTKPQLPRQSTGRQFPHVNAVKDAPTQRTIQMLWDRLQDVNTQVAAAGTTNTDLVSRLVSAEQTIKSLQSQVSNASIISGKTIAGVAPGPGQGDGPGEPPDDGVGGGGGGGNNQVAQQVASDAGSGCATRGSTGHVNTGSPLNGVTVGQVICGTGDEFPSLLAAVASLAAREANNEELIGRMIWHLQRAGFAAGKQRNPSQAISKDKITVRVNGVWYAFDVITGVDYTIPSSTQTLMVFPADTVADGGIAD
jgi:hypothetical protein